MGNEDLRIFELDSQDVEFQKEYLRSKKIVIDKSREGLVHFEHGTVLIYHDVARNGTGCQFTFSYRGKVYMKWFLEEYIFYHDYEIFEKAVSFGNDIVEKYKSLTNINSGHLKNLVDVSSSFMQTQNPISLFELYLFSLFESQDD